MKQSLKEEERRADVKMTIGENPDKKTSPVIGYFPSGFDPNSNESSGLSIKVYKNVNSRNRKNPRMQVVVGVNGSAVNFVGTNYSGEAATPQLCNYALGQGNRCFEDGSYCCLQDLQIELPDAAKEDDTAEEKFAKRNNTTLMYSTKKNIRKDKKRDMRSRNAERYGL